MKVRIVQTVDIDVKAWANEFGVSEAEVRQDVQAYFAQFCRDQVEGLGLQNKGPAK